MFSTQSFWTGFFRTDIFDDMFWMRFFDNIFWPHFLNTFFGRYFLDQNLNSHLVCTVTGQPCLCSRLLASNAALPSKFKLLSFLKKTTGDGDYCMSLLVGMQDGTSGLKPRSNKQTCIQEATDLGTEIVVLCALCQSPASASNAALPPSWD